MRWKLLAITSLAAAVVGAALLVALVSLLSVWGYRPPNWLGAAALILPLASITYAAIFVYRHTARRRKLQAALTALLSLLLTCGALVAADSVLTRFEKREPQPLIYSSKGAGS